MQQIRKEEIERTTLKETEYQLKVKELEKQLEDQRKLAEEMKRRAEQGSMQLQGEAQELLLEEILRDHFPYDQVSEVGKGVEGADCIQTVHNKIGTECGRIIFESKRTKSFQPAWIEKLKSDMRRKQADVAILVTQVYPKDMSCFGERDGVWICSFSEVIALTTALRHTKSAQNYYFILLSGISVSMIINEKEEKKRIDFLTRLNLFYEQKNLPDR